MKLIGDADEVTPLQEMLIQQLPILIKIVIVIFIVVLLLSQLIPLAGSDKNNHFKRFVRLGFGGIGTLFFIWFIYVLVK